VEIHQSAGQHGVSEDDVLQAVEHEMVSIDLEPDADPPKVLVIAPTRPGTCST
jgi:hypothetical protein